MKKKGIIITIIGIAILASYIIICRIFFRKHDDYGHTHFYGYDSYSKPQASQKYCINLLGKD